MQTLLWQNTISARETSLPGAEQVVLCQPKTNTSSNAPAHPAGQYISSWGQDLSGDTSGNKIHHQMLKCSIGVNSWWSIWEVPNLFQQGGGLCGYHLCAGKWLTLTLRHLLFPLADFSGTFSHNLTGAIALLALLHPFSPDSFRHRLIQRTIPSLTGWLLLAPLDVPLPLIIYSH